ncbi:hypothetical protein ABFS82_08G099100 [Erythranthe guttata]|uniref:uncharacterized protein LOC105956949 n=1 Tax=Erythranthe guttata TaxID=4155 RepID=UPI00064DF9FE|nr:PREDICTED: uncharacterized protein LOC105956949 [Erythranthe guttata]|eukprot:XP_012836317.1 PREDICTED: uncharacterized protein LOC105956949 [Erythranthe guttata]
MDNFEIPKDKDDTKKRNRDHDDDDDDDDDDGGRIDEETTRRRRRRLKRGSRWDETPTPTPTPPPTSFLTQTPYMYMPTPEDKAMRTSSWDDGTMYEKHSANSSCWVCQFLALSPNQQH